MRKQKKMTWVNSHFYFVLVSTDTKTKQKKVRQEIATIQTRLEGERELASVRALEAEKQRQECFELHSHLDKLYERVDIIGRHVKKLEIKRMQRLVPFLIDLIETSETRDDGRSAVILAYRIAGFRLPLDGNYLPLYTDTNPASIGPNLVVYGLSYAVYLVNLLAYVLDLCLPHAISNLYSI